MTEARETAPAFEAVPAKAAPVTLAGDAAARVAPYGSWRSPIMAEMVARAALRRGAMCTGLFCLSFVSAAQFIENSSALGKNGAYDDKATSDRILRVLTRDEGTGFPPEEQLTAYSRVKETTRR